MIIPVGDHTCGWTPGTQTFVLPELHREKLELVTDILPFVPKIVWISGIMFPGTSDVVKMVEILFTFSI